MTVIIERDDINEDCSGCKGACIGEHDYRTFNGDLLICPCSTCIVKVICIDGCDAYSDFADIVDDDKSG
jgi:hypothetical protein